MSEFGLEQIPALAGDYLGYEDDDDFGDDDAVAGYFDDDFDDDEIDIDYANGADEFAGDGVGDELGRIRRRRLRRRPRRRVRRARRRAPVRSRAPRPKKVIKVKDGQIILAATSTAAGVVSDSINSPYDFWPDEITTDGSDAGASISSLVVGDVNVIGPHPSDRSLPAGAYTSASQKKLSIKGHMIRNGQTIMVSGTIAGANDKLMIIIHGKKRVGNCS